MMKFCKLRKAMCLGRLIWIRPPGDRSAVFFAKKILNKVGVQDREIVCLTALQFIRYFDHGFSSDLLHTVRVLLIGELDVLCEKSKSQLMIKLSHHQMFKHRFDVNLVLISPGFPAVENWMHSKLSPHSVSLFRTFHPININEKIHDLIESASIEYGKPIWSLTADAAECLERVFIHQGVDYLQKLIFRAVQGAKSKKLDQNDLGFARKSMTSIEARIDLA